MRPARVRGYRPPVEEHAAMMKTRSERQHAPEGDTPLTPAAAPLEARAAGQGDASTPGPEPRKRTDELIVGRLLDHGRESYRFNPREGISYFVRIETREGRRTIWGQDLERALQQSATRPRVGDRIGARRIGSETVTVKRRERDAGGQLVKEEDVPVHRHRWVLEKREFFEARARAAETFRDPSIEPRAGGRRHPELLGSYLHLHAAELVARKMSDPEGRKKFVALVRNAMADSIARGESLKPVRLRERAPR